MSLMIIHRSELRDYICIQFRRPKRELFHYASAPIFVMPKASVLDFTFGILKSHVFKTRTGVEANNLKKLEWTITPSGKLNVGMPERVEGVHQYSEWTKAIETNILKNATVIKIALKRSLVGYDDVIRFSPCFVAQRRLDKVIDLDSSQCIDMPYPIEYKAYCNAFQLAFERAD